jgi:hypothetical protein
MAVQLLYGVCGNPVWYDTTRQQQTFALQKGPKLCPSSPSALLKGPGFGAQLLYGNLVSCTVCFVKGELIDTCHMNMVLGSLGA